jgi:hypothetical protein
MSELFICDRRDENDGDGDDGMEGYLHLKRPEP